jgi:hypothetical protein
LANSSPARSCRSGHSSSHVCAECAESHHHGQIWDLPSSNCSRRADREDDRRRVHVGSGTVSDHSPLTPRVPVFGRAMTAEPVKAPPTTPPGPATVRKSGTSQLDRTPNANIASSAPPARPGGISQPTGDAWPRHSGAGPIWNICCLRRAADAGQHGGID